MPDTAEKIHIEPHKREFGLGFGANHQIVVYTGSGPKTGRLLSDEECAEVKAWVESPADKRMISEIIAPETLAKAVHNRLLHMNIIDLARLMPQMLVRFKKEGRVMLFDAPVTKISSAMWKEIADTRPYILEGGLDSSDPRKYFSQLNHNAFAIDIQHHHFHRILDGEKVEDRCDDITMNGVSMEITATLFPILFEALDEPARDKVTHLLAMALHRCREDKNFFAPLVAPHLNQLRVLDKGQGACVDIINNGRTLMIRSPNGPRVAFQGDHFISRDLHFHPLKNADGSTPRNNIGKDDGKPEFLLYNDAKEEARLRDTDLDPNHEVVGQLHSIFITEDKKRALLLGANVTLGEPNKQLGTYIDFLKSKRTDAQGNLAPLAVRETVDASGMTFDPLACFPAPFNVDNVPEAPFMSLHLGGLSLGETVRDVKLKEGKNHVFYSGVRVLHLPDSLTVSPEQLRDLRALQPTLLQIDEATCVHPRQRFQPVIERWVDIAKPAADGPSRRL